MYKLKYIFFALIYLSVSSCAFALGTQASINQYEVTIVKIEFSPDASGDDNWVTGGVAADFDDPIMDIASVSFDELVAEFAQNLSMLAGTYVRCRLTISGTFVINGTVTYDGDTYYTTTGTNQPSNTTGPAADSTMINEDGNYEQTVEGNLTVVDGGTVTVNITMDTSSCIDLEEVEAGSGIYIIRPTEPTWTFAEGS